MMCVVGVGCSNAGPSESTATTESSAKSKRTASGSTRGSANAPSNSATSAETPKKGSLDDEDPYVAKHLKLLLEAASCGAADKRMEAWCQVAEGFPNGTSSVPSKGVKVGLTTFVVTAEATRETLDKYQTLSCLGVGKGGDTFASITSVKPDSDAETKSAAAAQLDVLSVLKGGRRDIQMTPDLKSYVDSLSAAAKFPTKKTDKGFRIEGGSNADVRRVGTTWLAVDVPAKDPKGLYISIFTDAGYH